MSPVGIGDTSTVAVAARGAQDTSVVVVGQQDAVDLRLAVDVEIQRVQSVVCQMPAVDGGQSPVRSENQVRKQER